MSSTKEIIAAAAPIAQRLVAGDEGEKGGKNLTVWILALKMAVKIELELYRHADPESALELAGDCLAMDELLSDMVIMPDPRANVGDGFALRVLTVNTGDKES